jgi:hypothetical protein
VISGVSYATGGLVTLHITTYSERRAKGAARVAGLYVTSIVEA